MGRAGGENKHVVGDVDRPGAHAAPLDIDGGDFRHEDGDVWPAPENAADRPGDIGGRQRGRRHLIEQRLEAMVVLPVDHDDLGIGAAERLRRLEPAEATTDDDDARACARL